MSLDKTTLNVTLNSGETVTAGAVTNPIDFSHQCAANNVSLLDGTGSGQAKHSVSFTVALSTTPTDIDLTALTASYGLDGVARNFTAIKTIIVENLDGTNSITPGGAPSNAWGGLDSATGKNIDPGGVIVKHNPVSGITVDGTHKILRLTAVAGTPSARVSLVGLGT